MPLVYCKDSGKINWRDATTNTYNVDGDLHIWRTAVSSESSLMDDLTTLNKAERARADSYGNLQDRSRFIISRVSLRTLLGKYLKKQPADIIFQSDEHKKPNVVQEGKNIVQYNLAHSGDRILIAVAGSPVGLDIERINYDFNFSEVLPDYFSNDEISAVKNATSGAHSFYSLWTRKEALVKGTGKGTDNDLQFIPCLDGAHTINSAIISSAEDWVVSSFEAADQYVAAIAHSPLIREIKFYETRIGDDANQIPL